MRRKRNASAGYTLASITRGAKFRRETTRTYLINALNDATGMSFKEYVNRFRIAFAKKLMDAALKAQAYLDTHEEELFRNPCVPPPVFAQERT